MSYILDALRKAERERSRARVPTLGTIHVLREREARFPVRWAVFLAVLGIGAVSAWKVMPLIQGDLRPAEKSKGRGAARMGPADQPPVTVQDGSTRSTPSVPSSATEPAAGAEGSRSRTRPAAPPVRASQPSDRPSRPLDAPAPTEDATGGMIATVPDAVAPPLHPPRGLSRPLQETAGTIGPAQASPPARAEPEQRADRVEAPPAGSSQVSADGGPLALEAALARLRLDVFVYMKEPEKRMVVINGQRYTVGQMVEDRYLLEAIIPEGAILGYQGQRALLRP